MLLSYRMTSRVLCSAPYHRQHCTFQAFEQFGALHIHNLDDEYPTRLGFDPSIPLCFEPQLDLMSHNWTQYYIVSSLYLLEGGGPRVVVSTVRGSGPGLGGLKETKMFLPHPRVKVSIVGSLRDREVACSVSDRQGSYFESCVWRTVSSQSSHHSQEVLLTQFSLYVHKGGLKPDSFYSFHLHLLEKKKLL